LRYLACLSLLGAFVFPPLVAAAPLYDASLGSLPTDQGWVFLSDITPGSSVGQQLVGGAAQLDTTTNRKDLAGYIRFDSFDATAGYRLRIDLKMLAETHVASDRNRDGLDDRAGFSLTLVGNNLQGIELGFWNNRVFAQSDNPLFTQAEHALFDTTASMTTYMLTVSGNAYSLYANGAPLLSGPLRDYSSFGLPYSVAGFLYLGDNTTSAKASSQLAYVSRETLLIPEPATWLLALIAMGCTLLRRVRPQAPSASRN